MFAYCHILYSCHRFNTWSACWVLQRNKRVRKGVWRQILAIVYHSRNTRVCLLQHDDGKVSCRKAMLSRVHAIKVRLVLSPSSTLPCFLCFFFDIFVDIVLFLLLSFFMFVFYFSILIHVFIIVFILFLFLLLLPFFSSSCSPYCYCFSSIFIDSSFAEVDECTASTPVCGIHFNCINTLDSYRCEYNHSCQGKKSVYHVFIFLMAKLNPFRDKWHVKCERSLSKCLWRNNKT